MSAVGEEKMGNILDIVFFVLLFILFVVFSMWLFWTDSQMHRSSVFLADSLLIILSIMALTAGMLIRDRHITSNISGKKETLRSWIMEEEFTDGEGGSGGAADID